jgi:hypothetical protein
MTLLLFGFVDAGETFAPALAPAVCDGLPFSRDGPRLLEPDDAVRLAR